MLIAERSSPDLEARLADLDARLRRVEARTADEASLSLAHGAEPAPPSSVPARGPEPESPASRRATVPPARPAGRVVPPAHVAEAGRVARRAAEPGPARASVDLERLLGGRVLAWVGAVAVLAGLVLLFALGVSQGWIDPAGRVLVGATLSAVLVGAGAWLRERRGRTDAAQAAAAAGAGGLFLAVTVASRGYDLIPPALGLALAAAVALLTAVIAIRWRAQVVGALGIAGALLAPVLAGLPFSGATALFVLVAAVAATLVLLRERWTWLAFAVLLLPAAQWVPGLLTHSWSAVGVVAVLAGFGAVGAAAALGTELRTRTLAVHTPAAYLLTLNAVLLALVGAFALTDIGGRNAGALWLLGLAGAHLAVGLGVWGRARDLALLALTLATLVANVALAAADLDDVARTVVWAASAVGLAALARWRSGLPSALVGCGLGGQLALATVSTLLVLRPDGGASDAGVDLALGALAAACLVSGRLSRTHPRWRVALDTAGLLAVVGLGAATTSGLALTLTWAALAAGLGQLARRSGDRLAAAAALVFLAAALLWCLVDQAPPAALVDGQVALGAAATGLGAVLLAALTLARPGRYAPPEQRLLGGAVAVVAVYLASLAVVSVAGSESTGLATGGEPTGAGQLALSALWTVLGVAALVTGLRLRRREVRLGALALLGLAVAKVFLFDLSTLTSLARVGSFLALGILLLLGAFAYQRLRPDEPLAGPPRPTPPGAA